MRRDWWIALAFVVLVAAAGAKPRKPIEVYALGDPRIEAVARALCRAKGIDPDHTGYPYPDGPVWETLIPKAREFVLSYDAVRGAKQ